jgi:hypothetical protein
MEMLTLVLMLNVPALDAHCVIVCVHTYIVNDDCFHEFVMEMRSSPFHLS